MDKNILYRIDFLLKQIERIENDVANKTYEEFARSDLLVRATSFSIMQVGEQLNRLYDKIGQQYPNIPWKNAIGMRNIIVHVYAKVDAKQVYKVATEDVLGIKNEFISIRNDLSNIIN